MGNNKIVFGNEVLIDLTEDTVDASTLYKGATAHARTGDLITGMIDPVLSVNDKTPDESGNVELTLNDLGGDLTLYVKKVEAPGYSDILTNAAASSASGYVRKVTGSRLMTNTEGDKLAGIQSGAEVNIQSDWNATDTTSDAYIKNKPALNFLPTSGGRMEGNINMANNSITNLKNAVNTQDAINKGQVDLSLSKKQDNITGSQGQIVGFNEQGKPIAQNAPVSGVSSVNGQVGDVSLSANDVHALPDTTPIPTNNEFTLLGLGEKSYNSLTDKPTKLSQFTNDPGYITSSGSITGNAATATNAEYANKDKDGNVIIDTYLKRTGGNMSGAIDMGSNKITSLATGTDDTDAINKKQLDDAIAGLGTLLNFKGTVPTVNDLPLTGNAKGDVWITEDTDNQYVWVVDSSSGPIDDWVKFGSDINLSGYLKIANLESTTGSSTVTAITQDAVTRYLNAKQNLLTGTAGNILVYTVGGVGEETPDSIAVTGIKGDNQSTYQKGQVSLGPDDIGALPEDGTAANSLKLENYSASDFMFANSITPVYSLSIVTYDSNGLVSSSETMTEITNDAIDTLWGS